MRACLQLFYFILFESYKIGRAKRIFFFPFYHTGGAERVHFNILRAVSDSKNYVVFTDKSYSDHFKYQFREHAKTTEAYEFLNRNAIIKRLFTKFLIKKMNESKELEVIFGCNSTFYYQLLPYLNKTIIKIDLVHAFSKPDYGIELASLPYASYLNHRVVINKKTYQDFINLYKESNLELYSDRLHIIPNGIVFNEEHITKNEMKKTLTIGFVGRWEKEKRPELFLDIVKKAKDIIPEIEFVTAGTHTKKYEKEIKDFGIVNLGEITNETEMKLVYQKMDIILITSYREGLPVVLMEAMGSGVIPITTNVGSIDEHITNNYNGFLIDNESDINKIVDTFSDHILFVYHNREKSKIIAENALKYARNEFGIANFDEKYRALLKY